MPCEAFLAEKAAKTEAALERHFAEWVGAPAELLDAMRYSLFAKAKRLRPALALGAADIVLGDDTPALPAACALEMIHTYSLIHDDLPAMDNDDLRRGRPTAHKAFGEATAILAGDTLLTMAFDIAAIPGNCAVIHELARASGPLGMAGGQFLDLEAEGKRIDLAALRRIHALKTGALIRAAVRVGALLAGARPEALDALSRYGEWLGLAFQIADDILDETGDAAAMGKPSGSDVLNQKATYPSILGMDRARAFAEEAAVEAQRALSGFGPEADVFRQLADYVIHRDR
jgi:geranylgeranyl diphosphate synthase type II